MKMITEGMIDEVSEQIGESEERRLAGIERFKKEQPAIFACFFSEDFDAFTQAEKEYALFLALVIFESVKKARREIPEVNENDFGETEEANWEKLQGVKARRFRERMDVFFDQYPQEDLLAFVEDALIDDEDTPVTKEGREPLFVLLKTIIDCLTK